MIWRPPESTRADTLFPFTALVLSGFDAVNGLSTLDRHEEAVKQVAVADRLVVSKTAMADPAGRAALDARLAGLNPRAVRVDADAPEAAGAAILANGLYDPATKIADVDRWLRDEIAHDHHGHHHHDVNRNGADIRSFSIVTDRPLDPMSIEMFVDLLRSVHGEKLLRMKAIVALSDNPDRPLVLHGVQTIFHPPQRLPRWPA